MIIIPFKEKWLRKVAFCDHHIESFYPNNDACKYIDDAKNFLESKGFAIEYMMLDPIAGKFKENVTPHDDSAANEHRYAAVFFDTYEARIHFFADKTWVLIDEPTCVIFDTWKEHAVLNETGNEYAWYSINVKFRKGYKHPPTTIELK